MPGFTPLSPGIIRNPMATQNFHRQLLDNLNTALLLVDRELRVSFINASAQALLELSETRSVGVCIQQLFPHQSDLMAEQVPHRQLVLITSTFLLH